MPRPPGLALAVAAAVAGSVALGWTSAAGAGDGEGGPDVLGEQLYERDCAWCHGPAGEGTARGVPLLTSGAAAAHFYLSTGRMPITDPSEDIDRGEPAYDGEELLALVAYVAALGDGPGIPTLEGEADVSEGGELYRLHCAQCHGASGVGVALAAGVTAPSVLTGTALQAAEALVVGPGAMPSFTPGVLDDEEVLDVVAYLEELRDAEDHGGHPLARSGRLDELAVAWGVGAVVLVLSARAIARHRP